MAQRMPRILLAKLGHGHKQALLNLAKRLGDAGFEIIYTELEDPTAIVETAIQEAVDHIGITVVEDGDIEQVRKVKDLLSQAEEAHVSIAVGGLIEDAQLERLKNIGVDACFRKGTTFDELVSWAQKNIISHGSMWQQPK